MFFFFFQAEDGIRDLTVTGVQTCALPISAGTMRPAVRVTAFDVLGNAATGFAGDVTLAITAGTGTGGATLLGTTTVTAGKGGAIFSNLYIQRAGGGYTPSAPTPRPTGATCPPLRIYLRAPPP